MSEASKVERFDARCGRSLSRETLFHKPIDLGLALMVGPSLVDRSYKLNLNLLYFLRIYTQSALPIYQGKHRGPTSIPESPASKIKAVFGIP
jgi:hypothetical protein